MSTFQEDVTEAIISNLEVSGMLCAKWYLVSEERKESVKEGLFSVVKEKMDLNGYGVNYEE